MSDRFPPAPWLLRGDMYAALLRVPVADLPAALLPARWPVRRDGAVLLAAIWVDYRPGGVLTYQEFMVCALGRADFPVPGTVLRIWVDDERSLAGGRQLWDLPKQPAEFVFQRGEEFAGSMILDGWKAAGYSFRPQWSVPGRWPVRLRVLQRGPTGVRRTSAVARGRLQLGWGELDVPADGELVFLRDAAPIAHLALRDFRMRFGVSSVLLPPG